MRLKVKLEVDSLPGKYVTVHSPIEVETPDGTFRIGVDNNGVTFVSTGMKPMGVWPVATNKVYIKEQDW